MSPINKLKSSSPFGSSNEADKMILMLKMLVLVMMMLRMMVIGDGDHNDDEDHYQGLHANKHRSSESPTALRCSTGQSGL